MPRKSNDGDYPPNWSEIAQQCKEDAGWKCVRCGHPHDPASGHTLTVHHIDMCPDHCEWFNLAALCQKCHLHIQAKVRIEQPWIFEHSPWFKPYVAGYYASRAGLPTDKGYVMDNLEYLLHLDRNT